MAEKNILLVDDSQDLLDCLALILADERIRISKAVTLADARTLLARQGFDLVYLDVRLPDGNGLVLYHELKLRNPALQVIIMTGCLLEQMLDDVAPRPLQVLADAYHAGRADAILEDLVLDDTLLFMDNDYLQHFLQHRPDSVALCRDSSSAASLTPGAAEVVVLWLPGTMLDLLALAAWLRARGLRQPLLLFTDPALAVFAGRARRRLAGRAYVVKPVDPQQLLDDMESILRMDTIVSATA